MSDQKTTNFVEFIPGSSGNAVIFLPGLQGSPLELGSIPKQIQKLGHTVCHPLIVGYSAQTDFSNYESWVVQINDVVDFLLQDHTEVSIVGLSMGATLALAYEAEYQKCTSVSLLSPVLSYDGWNVAWYYPLLYLAFKLGIDGWNYSESEPYGLKNIGVRRRVAKQVLAQEITEVGSSSLSAKHLHQGLRLISLTNSILSEIQTDLLIIASIDDDVVSPQTAEKIKGEISSAICKVIWLGNSYHIITLDNEREIVVNETVEFIQMSFEKIKTLQSYSDEAKELLVKSRLD